MNLTLLHISVIAAVVFFVIGAGFYTARKVSSAEGYSLGGRSSSAPFVAGSIAGTVVGGGATVGTAQLAYSSGLSAWWFTLGSGIAFIIMGLFYARRLRMTGLETIPEFLSLQYGKKAEILSSVISSVGILLSAVASCLPGIEIISSLFHISPVMSAVILTLLVILYTFFGGMKSTAVGGLLKMGIIWISLFIAGWYAFSFLETSQSWNSFPPDYFSLRGSSWGLSLSQLGSVIIGILCTQTYIQCIFSAATPVTATTGCFIAALIVIPVGLPSIAVGMSMQILDEAVPPILVLPAFLAGHVPPLVGGLALGGIILSLLGSIGGLSLGIGTMISRDILTPLFSIKDDTEQLRLTRITVLSVLLISSALAILYRGSQVLFWNYLSMGLRGGGIFLPMTLAVFFPGHLEKKWALISMGASTATALAAAFLPLSLNPLFTGLFTAFIFLLPGLHHKKQSHVSRETK